MFDDTLFELPHVFPDGNHNFASIYSSCHLCSIESGFWLEEPFFLRELLQVVPFLAVYGSFLLLFGLVFYLGVQFECDIYNGKESVAKSDNAN